jgi:hypothetical protein
MAATRAGALDTVGREALLRYVLRPPIAQERVVSQKSGLMAITLKRAYADGTVAVEMARPPTQDARRDRHATGRRLRS